MIQSASIIGILALVASTARADPLTDFERLLSRCKAAYAARGVIEVAYAEPAKSWVKRHFTDLSFAYDVKRTDSLVAPYSAFLEITETTSADRAPDEASAHALPTPSASAIRQTKRLTYAYRDGKWELAGRRDSSAFRRAGETTFDRPTFIDFSPANMTSPGNVPAVLRSCI